MGSYQTPRGGAEAQARGLPVQRERQTAGLPCGERGRNPESLAPGPGVSGKQSRSRGPEREAPSRAPFREQQEGPRQARPRVPSGKGWWSLGAAGGT